MSHSPQAFELTSFLTRSACRVRILEQLYGEPSVEKRHLREAVDQSRTTVQRNLSALEERGLITCRGFAYSLTPTGKLIVGDLLDLLDAVDVAGSIQPVAKWITGVEIDPGLLADATVVRSEPTDPYAPVQRMVAAIERADRFRGAFPTVGKTAIETARERVLDGSECELVFDGRSADVVRARRGYRESIEEMRSTGRASVWVRGEALSYYLGVSDDVVQLGFDDDDGIMRALLELDAEAARSWATVTFEEFLAESTSFSPSKAE